MLGLRLIASQTVDVPRNAARPKCGKILGFQPGALHMLQWVGGDQLDGDIHAPYFVCHGCDCIMGRD